MRFKGKTAYITGGGSGIGRATALAFAAEGAAVTIVDIDAEGADGTANAIEKLGGKCLVIEGNISSSEVVDNSIKETIKKLGGLDFVFNNAGCEYVAPLLETTDAQWDEVIDTNLKGTFMVARQAAEHMVRHKEPGIGSDEQPLGCERPVGDVRALLLQRGNGRHQLADHTQGGVDADRHLPGLRAAQEVGQPRAGRRLVDHAKFVRGASDTLDLHHPHELWVLERGQALDAFPQRELERGDSGKRTPEHERLNLGSVRRIDLGHTLSEAVLEGDGERISVTMTGSSFHDLRPCTWVGGTHGCAFRAVRHGAA